MIGFYDSNDNQLGTTSKKISAAMIAEELEREWTANIELPLQHPCAKFVTEENSIRIDGQMYDIVAITEYTGEQNSISFECEHRSYRLNDVMVETFTNLGTAADTLGKLLEGTSFTAGTVPSTGIEAFSIADPVTIRNAVYQLAYVHGWEVKWDNNVVNLVNRLGAERGKVFRYSRDLKNIIRTIDKRQKDDDGNYRATYEIEVNSLYRSGQGVESDYFELGDDVTVDDNISGKTFKTRIVKYERDLINPANDRIELNSFVGDIYDDTINLITDIDSNFSDVNGSIMNLTDEVRKALKEGQRYNNVSISTKDGFKAERLSDGLKVFMNAYDCFKIQKANGETVFTADDNGNLDITGSFNSKSSNGDECQIDVGQVWFHKGNRTRAIINAADGTLWIGCPGGKIILNNDTEVTNLTAFNLDVANLHITNGIKLGIDNIRTGITTSANINGIVYDWVDGILVSQK